ncbi:TorF family putative porin [Brevundimonas goettingensis]|jgi:uncharacterized protein (TIGR02001 family)|uniref:Porin n=1 Tax=Brevundimonas goettingensis TaxID=2774190 RepID=A0A975BZH2_9CAUL|nr:TorF family putative porin [Brevundimonas goettingensis]QTC89954.1 hypothetical protein IFJ75_11695 [Brevundimonas goettingensis]
MRIATCGLFGAIGVVAMAGAAQAADPVSMQIGAATQYLGKGVGKSNDQPSYSGSIEVNHNGFYGSLFAATAELSQGADAEILTTVGYRRTISGVAFDAAVINRDLPGTRKGVDANYTEYQVDASRKFGPVSTRFRVNYTHDGFAATQEAWWVELQGGVSVDSKTKATFAIADRTADGGAEYTAWNIGAKRKLNDRISLDLRWYDTDGHEYGNQYDGRLVAALTLSL